MPERYQSILHTAERFARSVDTDKVVRDLTRMLRKTMQCSWVVIYLQEQEKRTFIPVRSSGLPSRYVAMFREMPLSADKIPLLQTILKDKRFLLLTDSGSSDLLPDRLRKLLGQASLLAVPMVVRNQVMGIVFAARNHGLPPFADREIQLMADMIAHGALVISHLRLFDESLEMSLDMGKRIDVILTLDEINKAISSSLSHERIIATAMHHIERIIQCELVALFGTTNGELTVTASDSNNISLPESLAAGSTPDVSGSCVSRAFRQEKSCYVGSLAKKKQLSQLERQLLEAGLQSLMAIPMVGKEQTKGVLLLGDTDAGKFQSDDVFAIEKIAAQIAVALENARLYDELRSLFFSTVTSLANAIDAKSPWTKGHSERVMHVAVNIAREMGLDDAAVERVRLGGLLHDIGKIGIIEQLLEKPERLTDEEFPPMRLHPEKGVAILSPIEQLKDVLPGILHHHERFDGKGYPCGLKGTDIPLAARIISVADAFDAMLSERPYKKGLSVKETVAELQQCAGSQFDPEVVEHLRRHIAGMSLAEGKIGRSTGVA